MNSCIILVGHTTFWQRGLGSRDLLLLSAPQGENVCEAGHYWRKDIATGGDLRVAHALQWNELGIGRGVEVSQ